LFAHETLSFPKILPNEAKLTPDRLGYARSAYLTPAWKRNNLTIVTEAVVNKIILARSGSAECIAEGIQYTKDGNTKTITARKEVVVAAGAINSPRLLQCSGMGSADLLQKLGIEVLVESPGVGENLQNLYMVTVSSEVKDGAKTMDGLLRNDPAAIIAAKAAYEKQSGPMATSGTSITAQLPFPGIQTKEGKRDLAKLFETYLDSEVKGGRAKSHVAFDQAHEELVRSILSSASEAAGCYISFPGWSGFDPDGSVAPPPAGVHDYFCHLAARHTLPLHLCDRIMMWP
jgi:choline dehydrogenase-like flavoprotein